ncbi:MAG: rhomboid family intramembrane serine protease [Bdellovibrionaceae bacterium]|nr:rhomboid family intramembrane serine protease [Pseudobdellovibrionaceae bacterium]
MSADEFNKKNKVLVKSRLYLVGTLFSKRPHAHSFLISFSMVSLCFVVSSVAWKNKNWMEALSASRYSVFEELKIWQLLTTIFIHADGLHVLSNSFMLFIFGYFVFGYFGGKVFPLYSLIGAGLTNAFALWTYPPHVKLVGASGWVYFLAGYWLCMYLFIERQRTLWARTLRIFGVGLVVLFPSSFEMQVSYRVHGIGLFLGILMGFVYYYIHRKQFINYEKYSLETDSESNV